jgi:nitrile hydratase
MAYDPEQEPYVALRTKALESLLIEKGLLTAEAVDAEIAWYEQDIGPLAGAKVVTRARTDPGFKERLLREGGSVLPAIGLPASANLVVVENTPMVHNLVVCTVCSCYPWTVLGLPPTWYKSFAYRSRAVIEPRAVLREFGLELDGAATVHVWDSSAEQRYMVLQTRPAGTEDLTEAELAALVTRDAMIGVAEVSAHARGATRRKGASPDAGEDADAG